MKQKVQNMFEYGIQKTNEKPHELCCTVVSKKKFCAPFDLHSGTVAYLRMSYGGGRYMENLF